MSENAVPKISRRTLLAGTAGAAALSAAAYGAGNYWLGSRRNVSRSAWQEGDYYWNRWDGSAALGADDEGGAPTQSGKAACRRRIQPSGNEHAAAEPGGVGQLHQWGRAGQPRDL